MMSHLLAAFLALAFADPAPKLARPDGEKLLAEMVRDDVPYDPQPLHKLGIPGLEAVLDRLLPDTAGPDKPPPEEHLRELVRQLGDTEFDVREKATRELASYGVRAREHVRKAARSDDIEVRRRAEGILEEWKPIDPGRYHRGFFRYAAGIKDRDRLALLARRTAVALAGEMPGENRLLLLKTSAGLVARSGQDDLCDPFRPLVKHPDHRVAVALIQTIGMHKPQTSFPQVLFDALESDREAVVYAAIDWSPNCWDEKKAPEVRKRLRKIFEKGPERLKFQASFVLMHSHADAEAHRYLLEQTASKDAERARCALCWIGDSCNVGKPATRALLERLDPLLASKDAGMRRDAARALGVYAGEEVIRRLIPLLGEEDQTITAAAACGLRDQTDQTLLRRMLRDAADKHANSAVRAAAADVLAKLGVEP
jgi:HEAT repeat protein